MKEVEISVTLSEDLVNYLDEDPYIGDRSKFIAMLIRRWLFELEKSRREVERAESDPCVFRDFVGNKPD